MMSLRLKKSHLLRVTWDSANATHLRNSLGLKSDPQSHRTGSTPERKPRAAFFHTEAGSVNDSFLSRRTHCRYVFRGRGKSLEDVRVDYGPVCTYSCVVLFATP